MSHQSLIVVVCHTYVVGLGFFFFKQKTAYEMRISDWSSDVCSSELAVAQAVAGGVGDRRLRGFDGEAEIAAGTADEAPVTPGIRAELVATEEQREPRLGDLDRAELQAAGGVPLAGVVPAIAARRRAAAGPGVEQVPDEGPVVARVDDLGRAQCRERGGP